MNVAEHTIAATEETRSSGRARLVVDGALGALDGGRRWVWRQVVRTSVGKLCARDRSARILALGLGHIAVACALVAIGPQYLLLFGPIVLGVPHVVADVRYLVVRGPASLSPVTIVALAAPLAGIAGLRASEVLGGPTESMLEVALGFSAIAIGIALVPRARTARRVLIGAAAVALAVPAIARPYATLFVLLHGHNLVAMVIWLGFTRRTVRLGHRLGVAGATIAVTGAILAGALDPIGRHATLSVFAPVLAPGLDDALAYRVVLAYVFLQAMHYVFWLRLIPSTQATTPSASTFRRSVASLRSDFGLAGVVAIAVTAVAVPIAAGVFEPATVRDVYLAIAVFHAWLELSVLAYLLVSRERLGER